MSFISFIVIGLLSSFGVASLVEFYKKTIRKGNAKNWENWVIGAVASLAVSMLVCFTGLAHPFFENAIFNILIYGAVFFALQFFLDMKVIKKLIISALEVMDLRKFIDTVLSKFGLTAEKIGAIVKDLGITEDALKKALTKAGFSEEKINELVDILFPKNA